MTGDAPWRDAREREGLEQLVASERERTALRVAALTRDFDVIVASSQSAPPDDEHDPEGSTIAFERAQIAALVTQANTYLDELERAQDRLARGTYGTCERCGTAIVLERLIARPTARACVTCPAPPPPQGR